MNGPSSIQSITQRTAVNAAFGAPLTKCLSASVPCDPGTASAIACLDVACGPAAVGRRIGTIHINAINRMLTGWALSHVGQKCRERSAPAIAHHDSATAVVLKSRSIRIFTAGSHVAPRDVFTCVRQAMRRVLFTTDTPTLAPARGRDTVAKIGRRCQCLPSAVAFAMPFQARIWVGAFFGRAHDKAAKSLSGYVDAVSAHLQDFTLLGAN